MSAGNSTLIFEVAPPDGCARAASQKGEGKARGEKSAGETGVGRARGPFSVTSWVTSLSRLVPTRLGPGGAAAVERDGRDQRRRRVPQGPAGG